MRSTKSILILVVIGLCACSTVIPIEMTLADPSYREMENEAGSNNNMAMRRCAENMLKDSPANHAVGIKARIISPTPLVIEVNAVLTNIGPFNQRIPVTYRCEYTNRNLTSATWTSSSAGAK